MGSIPLLYIQLVMDVYVISFLSNNEQLCYIGVYTIHTISFPDSLYLVVGLLDYIVVLVLSL